MPHNAAVGGSSSRTSASSAKCTGYLSSGIGRKTKFGAIKLPPSLPLLLFLLLVLLFRLLLLIALSRLIENGFNKQMLKSFGGVFGVLSAA